MTTIANGGPTTTAEFVSETKQITIPRSVTERPTARREKEPPPDLKVIITGWTHKLNDWEPQLREAAPFKDYVATTPVISEQFLTALTRFVEAANLWVKTAPQH